MTATASAFGVPQVAANVELRPVLLVADAPAGLPQLVNHAVALAARAGVPVEVLYVWDPTQRRSPVEEWCELSLNFIPGDHFARLLEHHVVTRVNALVAELRERGLDARARWEPGVRTQTICHLAASGDYSAVVIGASPRHGLRELLLGSCAQQVVRSALVPVVVVPSERVHHP